MTLNDAILKDKIEKSNILKDIAYKENISPEDVRTAINILCFDPDEQNIRNVTAISDKLYRQKWYKIGTVINDL